MKARVGKIARLPRLIREELNRRLADGEPANKVAIWLNGLTEVQAVLTAEFGGRPIGGQNLTEWKQGGHREWIARQECLEHARDLAENAAEIEQVAGALGDNFARVVMARYAAAFAAWSSNPAKFDRKDFAMLRQFGADVALLRHGDQMTGRLQLERERDAREQLETDERMLERFWEWARRPEVIRAIFPPTMTKGEIKNRVRASFGLPPKDREADDDTEWDPDGDKPGPPGPGNPPAKPGGRSSVGGKAVVGPPPTVATHPGHPPPAPSSTAPGPGVVAQLDRVGRRLFDEIPNNPPALARLSARARGNANTGKLPSAVRVASLAARVFGLRPVDWKPTGFPDKAASPEEVDANLTAKQRRPDATVLVEEALRATPQLEFAVTAPG